ncbi:septation protein A [Tolumonas auensis]|uniref:septation protein A n=1 Tax=Tolumonas auensis TaxID=43948 RepID=UPI002AA5E2DF|nr:septation protein A [Tolumonas auensis]
MKQLLDFIPLIIFFTVYKLHDIYAATGALMATTLLQMIVVWFMYKKLERSQLITLALVLVFGAMTLFFHNEAFIKWKVTVLYAAFGSALWISQFLFRKPLIKKMLGKEMSLPDAVWNRINFSWGLFLWMVGALNVYIAFYLPTEIWVDFKVFGVLGLMLVSTLLTGIYIYRYLPTNNQQDKE